MQASNRKDPRLVFTIGHSTRLRREFLRMLRAHGVREPRDGRSVPRPPHNPPPPAALAYRHMPELGGLRRPRPDSDNGAWRNASFRGYADYMQTREFAAA